MADLENVVRPAAALVDNADEAEQVVPDCEVVGRNIAGQEANIRVDEEAEDVLIYHGDDLEEGIALPDLLRAEGGGNIEEDPPNEGERWNISTRKVKDIRRTLVILRIGGLTIGSILIVVATTFYAIGFSADQTIDAKGRLFLIGIATVGLTIGTAGFTIAALAWIKEHQQCIGLLSCPDYFWNFFARCFEPKPELTVRNRRGSDAISVVSEIIPENQNLPANLEVDVQEEPPAEAANQIDVPVDVHLINDPSNEEKTADAVAVGANIDSAQPSTSIGDTSSSFSSPYLVSSTSPDQIPSGSGATCKQTSTAETSELATESSISEIASSVSEGQLEIGKEQSSVESTAESPKG